MVDIGLGYQLAADDLPFRLTGSAPLRNWLASSTASWEMTAVGCNVVACSSPGAMAASASGNPSKPVMPMLGVPRTRRRHCAKGDGIVAGDDTAISMCLQNCFGFLKSLGLGPICGLRGNKPEVRIFVQHGWNPWVRTCALVSDSMPGSSAYAPPAGLESLRANS